MLLLTLHHAIVDGWSIGVLFEELSSRYAALAGYPSVPLPKPPPAFSDVARWQRWWCGTDAARRQAVDWTDEIARGGPRVRRRIKPQAHPPGIIRSASSVS